MLQCAPKLFHYDLISYKRFIQETVNHLTKVMRLFLLDEMSGLQLKFSLHLVLANLRVIIALGEPQMMSHTVVSPPTALLMEAADYAVYQDKNEMMQRSVQPPDVLFKSESFSTSGVWDMVYGNRNATRAAKDRSH